MLYSSEHLMHLDPELFQDLVAQVGAEGYRVRAVGYVRNVVGHALSAYSQHVKRAGCTLTFTEFLDVDHNGSYGYGARRCPRRLVEILGREAVTLIHYNAFRDRLFEHFTEDILGVPVDSDFTAVPEGVNRSLTPTEIALMRGVNARVSSQPQATAVSDAILRLEPFQPSPPRITTAESTC